MPQKLLNLAQVRAHVEQMGCITVSQAVGMHPVDHSHVKGPPCPPVAVACTHPSLAPARVTPVTATATATGSGCAGVTDAATWQPRAVVSVAITSTPGDRE